jgi:uncharacterized NAD-dependent epimerase/dehydratase family protein
MAVKYFREHLTPSAATETTLYTVPDANTAILSSLRVTNTGSASTTVNVAIYPDGGGTGRQMLEDAVLAIDSTMDVFNGVSCVMEQSDIIKVTSSQADVDFYLSYMEVDRN